MAGLMAALALQAGDKKTLPVKQMGNDKVAITATLYPDKDSIRGLLGSDLGGYFTVVRVEIVPKSGKLAIDPDDFMLRSYNDGQKSKPFAPSQIAGKGALVISQTGSGGIAAENPGPVWGGIPGTGMPPGRMGGNQGVMGNAPGETETTATVKSGAGEKDNPLLATLKQKVLPLKETSEPLSGLLYFSLEGRHKPKDLELQYNGPAGKLTATFKKHAN